MDFESVIITIILSLVAAVGGGFVAWLFKSKERKESVERIRSDKADSERRLAKELRDESQTEAVSVREEMRNHVSNLLAELRYEISLAQAKTNSAAELREVKIQHLAKEFYDYKSMQNSINEKTLKAIEFVQTMLWGPEAKSMPPYMLGEDETQEHRDEPEVGMFKGKTP